MSHPVVISSDGTSIGGLSSSECNLQDPVAKLALEVGHIIIVSVESTTEVAESILSTFVPDELADSEQVAPVSKKRSPRKKPAQAKEN